MHLAERIFPFFCLSVKEDIQESSEVFLLLVLERLRELGKNVPLGELSLKMRARFMMWEWLLPYPVQIFRRIFIC